jgi:hypothetical protein
MRPAISAPAASGRIAGAEPIARLAPLPLSDVLPHFGGVSGEFPRRRNLAQLRRSALVEPSGPNAPIGAQTSDFP